MGSNLRSRTGRPSPATIIALVAVVFAMSGMAIAAPDTDEVTVRTFAGGPVNTTQPGEEVQIPLGPAATFTQRAGEPMLIIARGRFNWQPGFELCDVEVSVRDRNDPAEAGIENIVELWDRGFAGMFSNSELLAAPANDTQRRLEAVAFEVSPPPNEDSPKCDQEDPNSEPPDSGNDTATVRVRISVVSLRN